MIHPTLVLHRSMSMAEKGNVTTYVKSESDRKRTRFTMSEWDSLCRLCGNPPPPPLQPLDGQLPHLVLKYTGITIMSDDALPNEICNDCVDKIKSFHEYVQRCVEIQNKLFEISGSNIKIECDPPNLEDFKSESFEEGNIYPIKVECTSDGTSNYLNNLNNSDYDDSSSDVPLAKVKSKKKSKIKKLKKTISHKTNKSKSEKSNSNLKQFIRFNCCVCKENCENWFRLRTHIIQVHNQTPSVKCSCGFILKSKTSIERHVTKHNEMPTFACDKCSHITKTESAMEKHKLKHLPKVKKLYSCFSCSKIYKSKEYLKSHEKIHFSEPEKRKYPCAVCGNEFSTKSAVLLHIRSVHEKLKPYICDVCGYACSTNGELTLHRVSHSDERPFECKICSKKFKTSSILKVHIDIHDATSYPCAVCGKVLNSRRTLKKHYLVHEELCKHVCTYCNKAFKRRQTLKAHLTIHTGDKPIQCQWCPQTFAYGSVYSAHKHKVHFDKLAPNENSENNVSRPAENCNMGTQADIDSQTKTAMRNKKIEREPKLEHSDALLNRELEPLSKLEQTNVFFPTHYTEQKPKLEQSSTFFGN